MLVCLLVGHGLASTAAAQVNVQVLERDRTDEGWNGALSGAMTLQRGNVDLLDVGAAGDIEYQTLWPREEGEPAWIEQRVLLRSSVRYAERSGSAFLSNAFNHARWTAMWHRRIGSEIYLQHQYNEFWRLELRMLAGAGARTVLVNQPSFIMAAGSSYMVEFEKIDVAEGASDDPETTSHRWSNYLTARFDLIAGRLLAQNTLYVQPRWDDFADVRILDAVELIMPLSKRLSFVTSLTVLYDHDPPTAVETTDLTLLQTFSLSL